MSDYLVKSLACDGHLRAYAIDATETIREAQKRQDTWSAASAALGRSMIGTLLLATSSLKGDEKMTVKINGNGPVGGIVIDGNSKGTVKGYVQNPHVHLPLNDKGKIDVKGAVGTEGFFGRYEGLRLEGTVHWPGAACFRRNCRRLHLLFSEIRTDSFISRIVRFCKFR